MHQKCIKNKTPVFLLQVHWSLWYAKRNPLWEKSPWPIPKNEYCRCEPRVTTTLLTTYFRERSFYTKGNACNLFILAGWKCTFTSSDKSSYMINEKFLIWTWLLVVIHLDFEQKSTHHLHMSLMFCLRNRVAPSSDNRSKKAAVGGSLPSRWKFFIFFSSCRRCDQR